MSLASESLRRSGSLVETAVSAARRASFPALVVGFALAYFLAAKVGIAMSLPPEGIVILWPPNAIVLAVLLSVKTARWPIFLAATVVTEVIADVPAYPLLAAIGYGLVNFSEAALAAALLRRYVPKLPPIASLRDFIAYVLIGPVLASGVAALFGAAIYKLGNPDLDYLHYWRVFWFGDATGLLILGTIFLAWRSQPLRLSRLTLPSAAEAAALGLALLGVAYWALFAEADAPRVYLLFPFLLWAAIRFGVPGASASILVMVAAAIWSAINDVGPFATLSDVDEVVSLQGLIAVAALSTFTIAFGREDSRRMNADLRRAYRELEQSHADLDRRVAERTAELEKSLARNRLLLREVHHRIKNSLQVVSSLLSMQSRGISDAEAQDVFARVQGQVGAIATTYDLIHQMESAETVNFCAVVPDLCKRIAAAAGPAVQLSTKADGPTPVCADTAIALSLALNELVTNSMKHAAASGAVSVLVSCRREGDRLVLTIADDGPGFPPGFDLDKATGFGARMARTVVAQANGDLHLVPSDHGAVVEISAPMAGEPEERIA